MPAQWFGTLQPNQPGTGVSGIAKGLVEGYLQGQQILNQTKKTNADIQAQQAQQELLRQELGLRAQGAQLEEKKFSLQQQQVAQALSQSAGLYPSELARSQAGAQTARSQAEFMPKLMTSQLEQAQAGVESTRSETTSRSAMLPGMLKQQDQSLKVGSAQLEEQSLRTKMLQSQLDLVESTKVMNLGQAKITGALQAAQAISARAQTDPGAAAAMRDEIVNSEMYGKGLNSFFTGLDLTAKPEPMALLQRRMMQTALDTEDPQVIMPLIAMFSSPGALTESLKPGKSETVRDPKTGLMSNVQGPSLLDDVMVQMAKHGKKISKNTELGGKEVRYTPGMDTSKIKSGEVLVGDNGVKAVVGKDGQVSLFGKDGKPFTGQVPSSQPGETVKPRIEGTPSGEVVKPEFVKPVPKVGGGGEGEQTHGNVRPGQVTAPQTQLSDEIYQGPGLPDITIPQEWKDAVKATPPIMLEILKRLLPW